MAILTRRQALVVAALGVIQILAWGSSFYLLTVLAAPIRGDTGWPLPWIVGSLSAGLLVAGVVSPAVGRNIGRLGGRQVLALSAVLLATGLVVIGSAPVLPLFLLGWLVIGAGMGAGLYDAAFAVLGRHYGSTARNAISVLTLFGGFAASITWVVTALLEDALGWRGTCFVWAAVQLGISLPLILIAIPADPGPLPAAVAGRTALGTKLSRRELWLALLLGGVVSTGGAIMALVSVHIVALLQAQGATLVAAVGIAAVIGPAQVGGRLVEMAFRGKYHPLWSLSGSTALLLAGSALLWAGPSVAAAALVAWGAGNGIFAIARATLPLALFSPDRYATLMGSLARPNYIAQALAPFAGAVVLDATGAGGTIGLLVSLAAVQALLVAGLWVGRRPD